MACVVLGVACAESGVVDVVQKQTFRPQFAKAECSKWSCEPQDCGYDPEADDRGACCIESAFESGNPPVEKPNCWSTPGSFPPPPPAACDRIDNQCLVVEKGCARQEYWPGVGLVCTHVRYCHEFHPGFECSNDCPENAWCRYDPIQPSTCFGCWDVAL